MGIPPPPPPVLDQVDNLHAPFLRRDETSSHRACYMNGIRAICLSTCVRANRLLLPMGRAIIPLLNHLEGKLILGYPFPGSQEKMTACHPEGRSISEIYHGGTAVKSLNSGPLCTTNGSGLSRMTIAHMSLLLRLV